MQLSPKEDVFKPVFYEILFFLFQDVKANKVVKGRVLLSLKIN